MEDGNHGSWERWRSQMCGVGVQASACFARQVENFVSQFGVPSRPAGRLGSVTAIFRLKAGHRTGTRRLEARIHHLLRF
jgi:hypothetical protein